MSSELSGAETDRPRETGPVTRDSGGPPEVSADAGDNPTMSLSELYERRDADARSPEPALGEGVRGDVRGTDTGTEAGYGPADEGPDAGYPAYDDGYPVDTPYEGFDGYGANETIDGQVVSDPGADSDPVPDWEAGNWDPPAEAVGDAGLVADDGADDSRFDGWPDVEPAVAAADVPYDREGDVGGQDGDGSPGYFGRTGELQDQGEAETGGREDGERAGPGTRPSADASQQGEQGEETAGEQDAEGQGEDGREEQPRDLAPVQHPVPDAETDRPAETSAEAAPDQLPDDPRMAAMEARMERMMATVEAMQDKLEASEARNDALEAKTAQLEQELDDLKTDRPERRTESGKIAEDVEQSEYLASSDSAEEREHREVLRLGDEADPAGTDVVDDRAGVGDSRDGSLVQEETERQGYTEETKKVLTSGWGLLKAAGVSVPGADLVLGGQETREAFEKLPADQQYQVMKMGETAGLAFSSMPPETAAVALGISIAGPAIREKFGNIADRWRRKD